MTDKNQENIEIIPLQKKKNYSLISKDNNLITARYSLTGWEQKLLYRIFEEVQQNGYTTNIIPFKMSEMYSSYKEVVKSNITKKEFQQLLHSIQDKEVYLISNNEYIRTHWFALIATNDLVHYKLDIDKYVFPYIQSLTKCFTSLESASVYSFSSFYTMRFYELLKKWYPVKTKIEYTIEELKTMLELDLRIEIVNGVEKKINASYENNSNFERKIIKKAVKEINEKSELNVTYEMIKRKRKYYSVCFYVSEKEIIDEQFINKSIIKNKKEKSKNNQMSESVIGVKNEELMNVLTPDVKEQFLSDFNKIDFTEENMIKLFKEAYQEYMEKFIQATGASKISLNDNTYIQFMILFRTKINQYILLTTT